MRKWWLSRLYYLLRRKCWLMDGAPDGEGTSLKAGGLVLPLRDLGPHKTLPFSMSTHPFCLCAPWDQVSFLKSISIIPHRRRHSADLHGVRVPMDSQPVDVHPPSQTTLVGDQQHPVSHPSSTAGTCPGFLRRTETPLGR